MQSTEECHCYSQENQQETGVFPSGTINRLKMLTLNNNNSTLPPTATAAPPLAASLCRGSSTKRRSPSSSSFSLQEPSAKKQLLTLLSDQNPDHAATKPSTSIKTQFTPPSPAAILRRCISDPVSSPGTVTLQSPKNANSVVPAATPSLPPLPQAFRRSVSDPVSRSPSSGELGLGSRNRGGESPMSLKTLKERMGEMREMIQWWEKVVDEEVEEEESNGCGEITEEVETEEAVNVERTGECLVLHFKCPCKKEYQILLSGSNCYYKLM